MSINHIANFSRNRSAGNDIFQKMIEEYHQNSSDYPKPLKNIYAQKESIKTFEI